MADDAKVRIELTSDEALVLFEWLANVLQLHDTSAQEPRPGLFEHRAEEHAASAVLGRLEEQLAEPFLPDYAGLVDAARARLCDRWGD